MKFNLSDFVQLDTKGLLAVNGGYYCNGSSNTTVYSNPYYSGNNGGGNGHGGGGSGNGNGNGGGGCGKTTTPPADDAGKMGYILYDWEGDGKYDHIEFGMISEDGLSYSFYNNQGFEYQDKYSTRTFAQDPNAGAKPDSPGSVRFIPLN